MIKKLKIWSIIILISFLSFSVAYKYFVTTSFVEVLITDKESKTYQEEGVIKDKYLIYTTQETFELKDDIWFFNFDSSDKYGKIINGKHYRFKVQGIRSTWFSWYRNIISVQSIEK